VHIRTSSAVALAAIIVVGGCRIERTPRAGLPDPAGVARTQITAMLDNYEQALLSGESRRIASFFAPAARLYLPDTPDIFGRGEVDAAFAGLLADTAIVQLDMRSEDIDVVAEVAYQIGTFTQTLRTKDGDERAVAGRFVIRWVRGPETRWLIERMLVNHYPRDSAAVAQQ